MASFELAQLNIAKMRASIDSPLLADFVANLDRINALAERSPGFVWRLKDEAGDATAIRHFGDETLVNLSVWTDVDSLHQFVYRSAHVEIMRRRNEWFERMGEAYTVLWWLASGQRPTLAEAGQKLSLLQTLGASPEAFTFRQSYPVPTAEPMVAGSPLDDSCPAV